MLDAGGVAVRDRDHGELVLVVHDDALDGRAEGCLDQHRHGSHITPHEGPHQAEVEAPEGHVTSDETQGGIEVLGVVLPKAPVGCGAGVGELDPGLMRCAHRPQGHPIAG